MEHIGIFQAVHQIAAQLTGHLKKDQGKGRLTEKLAEEPDDDLITVDTRIAEMLMQAVDSKLEVLVTFGSKVLVYRSKFMPDKEIGPGGSDILSSEYLRDRAYIVIGPTDPLDGITKLQNGRSATLSFVYGGKFNEFEAHIWDGLAVGNSTDTEEKRRLLSATRMHPKQGMFRQPGTPSTPTATQRPTVLPKSVPAAQAGVANGGMMGAGQGVADGVATEASQECKLTFPDKIFRRPQRRSTVRVKCSEDARVSLSIKREAGYSFFAPIVDVSVGGVCFVLPNDEAIMFEGSEEEVTFRWSEGQYEEDAREVTDKGTLLKMGNRQGKPVGQLVFSAESYEVIREMGELVAHIERARLQSRSGGSMQAQQEYAHAEA